MSIRGQQQPRESRLTEYREKRSTHLGQTIFDCLKPRWIRVGLASALLFTVTVTIALHVAPVRASHTIQLATVYGPKNSVVLAAVQAAQWPQQKNNWCGVATVAAIAQFRGLAVSQKDVANYLNSTAGISAWGTPKPSSTTFGPAFKADIAGDVGTDPRSLAAGLSSQAQGHYHQMVELGSNYDATIHLVDDLIRTQEPVSVIVFHGLHSVLVSGVAATANPVTNPSSITGLEVWDPGFGIPNGNIQGAQEVLVPLNTWLTNDYYWATPYNANYYGSIASDPDPAVGPYTYAPSAQDYGHLWIGHYVYLRQDATTDPAFGVTVDWAFSQSGALITGFHGEVPAGYTGPQTSILTTITLGDTSIAGPAFWSDAAYQPPAGTSAPVSVLAWTGTDSSHHLNVETSTDGIHYAKKLILNDKSFTRPSVIVVPAANSNVVVLAWAGTSTAHHLTVMYDVYGAQQTVTLPYSSSYAPSLAYFDNQIWLAWTGTDSNHTLNVLPLGSRGLTPGSDESLSPNQSQAAPNLLADPLDNLLLLSWSMSGTDKLNLLKSADGSTWTAALAGPSSQTSHFTPPLLVIDPVPTSMPAYYWSWTGTNKNAWVNVMGSTSLGTWSKPPTILSVSSVDAPSVGYVGQQNQIVLVWTSTSSAHSLNVSILQSKGELRMGSTLASKQVSQQHWKRRLASHHMLCRVGLATVAPVLLVVALVVILTACSTTPTTSSSKETAIPTGQASSTPIQPTSNPTTAPTPTPGLAAFQVVFTDRYTATSCATTGTICVTSSGSGQDTTLGTISLLRTSIYAPGGSDSCGSATTKGTLTLITGDTITFTGSGSFCRATQVASFTYTITGGSGKYLHADGSGTILVPLPTSSTTGTEKWIGTLGT